MRQKQHYSIILMAFFLENYVSPIQSCRGTFFCGRTEKTIHLFLFALAFKIDEKASDYEHYRSILVSFLGKTEHFSVKNGVF